MSNYPRFTLRIPRSLLNKLSYTAKFYGRTKNKEIEMMIRKYINDFERMYGSITSVEDDE